MISIELTPAAQKAIRKLDKPIRQQVIVFLEDLQRL